MDQLIAVCIDGVIYSSWLLILSIYSFLFIFRLLFFLLKNIK